MLHGHATRQYLHRALGTWRLLENPITNNTCLCARQCIESADALETLQILRSVAPVTLDVTVLIVLAFVDFINDRPDFSVASVALLQGALRMSPSYMQQ